MSIIERILAAAAADAIKQRPKTPTLGGRGPSMIDMGPGQMAFDMDEVQKFMASATEADITAFMDEIASTILKEMGGEAQDVSQGGIESFDDFVRNLMQRGVEQGKQKAPEPDGGSAFVKPEVAAKGPTIADILGSIRNQRPQPTQETSEEVRRQACRPAGVNEAKSDDDAPELDKAWFDKAERRTGDKAHHVPIDTNDNGVALRAAGLNIIHFHEATSVKGQGMTICYRDLGDKITNQRVVEVATAIVHPDDTFSKKKGTALAFQNFQNGQTIKLPVIDGLGIVDSLKTYFWGFSDKYSEEFFSKLKVGGIEVVTSAD